MQRVTEETRLKKGQHIVRRGYLYRVERSGAKRITTVCLELNKDNQLEDRSRSTSDPAVYVGALIVPPGKELIAKNVLVALYWNQTFDGLLYGRSCGKPQERDGDRLLCAALGYDVPFYRDSDYEALKEKLSEIVALDSKSWEATNDDCQPIEKWETYLRSVFSDDVSLECGIAMIAEYGRRLSREIEGLCSVDTTGENDSYLVIRRFAK